MKATTLPPRSPEVHLIDLTPADTDALEDHATFEGLAFTDVTLSNQDLTASSFVDCEFRSLTLDDTKLKATHFSDCLLVGVNAPVLNAPRSAIRNVELQASRVGALELYDADIRLLRVADCRLGWVNLRTSVLQDVSFKNCIFDEIDLSSAKWTRVAFDRCRAQSVRFSNAQLCDVDLRGLELAEVLDLSGMKGATINPGQLMELAPLLAHSTGLKVED